MYMEVFMNSLVISSVILAGLGFLFFARYLYLDRKAKEEKSFIVVGVGLLAFWFFGGTGLMAIAFFLFCLFIFRFLFG